MTAAERWPHLPTILAALRRYAAFGHASRPVGVDALRSAADTLSEMSAHIDAQDAQIQALADEVERLQARITELEAELVKPVAGPWRVDPRFTDGGRWRPDCAFKDDVQGWEVYDPISGNTIAEGPETGDEAEALADEAAEKAGWRLT